MNKVRIFNMMSQGMTEQPDPGSTTSRRAVRDVLVVQPGAAATVGPWAASGRGAAAGHPDDPPVCAGKMPPRRPELRWIPAVLAQIEKDLEKLD